ncbi:nonribosomal peptide synthetase [Xylariales sp. PMI_506]|nr:nonribosomal peptide synthetase [Xylariales sp. PMI_506]
MGNNSSNNNSSNTVDSSAPYGNRLIPHIIDETARQDPQREAFQIPRSSDPKDGWKTVTFKEFANAVNHVAHRIVEISGEPPKNAFPTIAYIGPNDARYVVMMVGAIKAGYKVLFISPRNSQEGQINLFDKTDCHILCFPESHHAMVQPWLQERDMSAVQVGEMDKWFPEREVPHFPYTKTWEEAEWDPVVVLHTSGSTGFPKPIVATVGMISTGDAFHELPDWQGSRVAIRAWAEDSKRVMIPMPLFHAAGLYCFISLVYFWNTPVALGPVRPLSTDIILQCLEHAAIDSILLPPAILEDMSQDKVSTEALSKMKLVIFGGGNLAREAGNRLVEGGVHLTNLIAATEFAPWAIYHQPDPKLWQYFKFHSDVFGADWRPQEDDEKVFELVVVRKAKQPGLQGVFYTFPNDNEYYTKDLYKPHPSVPNLWIYHGRADNIIVFSNGEKLNPVTIEEIVTDHPQIKGSLVVGSNRFQPGLIIEPVSHPQTEEEEKALIDSVWPLVIKANKETVAHGQIGRDFIALSNPSKPFLRAGKGSIQRAGTVKLYEEDINQLYNNAGHAPAPEAPKLDISSEDALIKSIQDMFANQLDISGLEADTDFFSAGVDSMQVINASRLLRAGLEAVGHQVDATSLATRVVYGNPTPRRLAQYLLRNVLSSGTGEDAQSEDAEQQDAMEHLYKKYTREMTASKPGRPEAALDDQVVLLTGSTGMLGSYLLHQLVQNPRVKKVICLNRAEDGGVKQQAKAMKDRGLTTEYASKTEFHHIDISRSDLGLPREVYQRLLQEADRFIHNAWPVNFNITVETFEPHLRGVRNVADLAARAEKRLAVVFISSIGTADRWDGSRGPVPEKRLEDLSLPGGGYGRSKMVGSMIMEDAARAGDFPAATIRVGQVGGPEAEAGAWNRHEWLPSIIASSLHLRALPSELGLMNQVDWTPVERIAGLVLEVIGAAAGEQRVDPADISGYFHGVNPSRTTWQELAPAVQAFYGRDRLPELVRFSDWVERLERSQTQDMQAMDANPGIKLLDTYRGMAAAGDAGFQPVVFDMTRTTGRSKSMREAQAVSPAMMQHWCKQWGY